MLFTKKEYLNQPNQIVGWKQYNTLQTLIDNGKITTADVVDANYMTMKKEVMKIHKNPIKKRGDGRAYYTHFQGGMLTASSERDLIQKLYDRLYPKNVWTLNAVFVSWQEWAVENVSNKTRSEYIRIFNKYIMDSLLNNMLITDIAAFHIQDFFNGLSKLRLSKQTIGNLKSVLSHIYKHAIRLRIERVSNIALSVDTRCIKKKVVSDDDVFTLEEWQKFKTYINTITPLDIYDYALAFAMEYPLRIGELTALKWSNVSIDNIYVCEQITPDREVKAVKGDSELGNRYLPLTDNAKRILNEVRGLGYNSPYIFVNSVDGTLNNISDRTFNGRIKKHCNKIGIPYHSSHKIRFYNASLLYLNGMSIRNIQYYLGHTSPAMTEHYLRNIINRHNRLNANDQYMQIISGVHDEYTDISANKKSSKPA